eukprot:m.459666 g.459666  ORF g.459666 m.459666 type:complete len:140 (-) comp21806_c0_seq1:86-505(-)
MAARLINAFHICCATSGYLASPHTATIGLSRTRLEVKNLEPSFGVPDTPTRYSTQAPRISTFDSRLKNWITSAMSSIVLPAPRVTSSLRARALGVPCAKRHPLRQVDFSFPADADLALNFRLYTEVWRASGSTKGCSAG